MKEKFQERLKNQGFNYAIARFVDEVDSFLRDVYNRMDELERILEAQNEVIGKAKKGK